MSIVFFNQLKEAHNKGNFYAFIKESEASGDLFKAIPALQVLKTVPQDPRWHPEGDVWTHTLLLINKLPPDASFALSLCALLHDLGKATTTVIHDTGRISARGHESVSKKIAAKILLDLGADAKLTEEVLFLVFRHMIAHSKDANAKTLNRLINEASVDLVDQLLMHGVADVKGGCGDLTDCIRLRELFENISTKTD